VPGDPRNYLRALRELFHPYCACWLVKKRENRYRRKCSTPSSI
jgi:hypothetical protein